MPFWIGSFLLKFGWAANMLPALKVLGKFWREALIMTLITVMSLGYAYYTSKISDMGVTLQNTEINFQNAKANATAMEEGFKTRRNNCCNLGYNNRRIKPCTCFCPGELPGSSDRLY